jgi:DNA-binding MarR family transcriptional regulator
MNNAVEKFLHQLKIMDHREAAFRHLVDVVSMYEFRVLAMIANEPLILKSMANERAVAAQGIGRLVERLRQRGFVKVERNDRDRREKVVKITISGRAVLRRCHKAIENVLAESYA